MPDDRTPPFSVVIGTRDRHEKLSRTLDALMRQDRADFDVIVVDQSARLDPELQLRAAQCARLRLIRDSGRGLSRARNMGWRAARSEWIAFLDDDCRPDRDWASELHKAIVNYPDASLISGDVRADVEKPRGGVLVSLPRVKEERVIRGSRRLPSAIGMGICTIRRRTIIDLGGYDERFGAGASQFPAAEDTDFNYRFLRAGGVAYVTPKIRAVHEQWRSPADTVALYRDYSLAWAGFALKHALTGDPSNGLRLWLRGLRHSAGMLRSAIRLRSRVHHRVAAAMLAGYFRGTLRGGLTRW